MHTEMLAVKGIHDIGRKMSHFLGVVNSAYWSDSS